MEFAFVVPILFLIVFGVVEFGWAFYQNMDVRHGAREGARVAAVNAYTTSASLASATCGRMDNGAGSQVRFQVPNTREDGATANANDIGGAAKVTVTRNVSQLTGFMTPFGLSNPYTLTSTVWIRLEQKPSWSNAVGYDSGNISC